MVVMSEQSCEYAQPLNLHIECMHCIVRDPNAPVRKRIHQSAIEALETHPVHIHTGNQV